ncbi:MAG: hypothetical protein KY476_15260 [Planctomycetes bacterium]|nr:hypothetical protein [Planctomycetota bacterium]
MTPESAAAKVPAGTKPPDRIYLISYPKIVFMYPTLLAALAAGIWSAIRGDAGEAGAGGIVSLVFLAILGVNLVVLSFDFPRATSLTLFFVLVAVFLGLWLLSMQNPNLLPAIGAFFGNLRPLANATFYFILAGMLLVIFVVVYVTAHFDYWEVRPNELLHHHGVLSDLERFSAPNLRVDKEINDVFEYLLLRAGRLILHPSQERRAIVLENVFFINSKEDQLTRMLGAVQVQVREQGQA